VFPDQWLDRYVGANHSSSTSVLPQQSFYDDLPEHTRILSSLTPSEILVGYFTLCWSAPVKYATPQINIAKQVEAIIPIFMACLSLIA